CVPPDDPSSNYGMARAALLGRVPIPAANVHRIHGEDEPTRAAAAYQAELVRALSPSGGPPRLDLVLLGLGADGPTASLLPGLPPRRETERWVVAERVPALGAWRVTLTRAAINAAAEVIFLVTGKEKAAALRRGVGGPRAHAG